MEILNKYFKDKNEKSLVILTNQSKAEFEVLKYVCNESFNLWCTFFGKEDLEDNIKLTDLRGKPRQIIFIEIKSSYALISLPLINLVENIVIFSDDECNSESRTLILDSRPKFALFVHNGNIEKFAGPVDNLFLNMIDDSDLHNNINIVPQHC